MTHSIGMRIGIKTYDEVRELRERIINPDEDFGMIFYPMKKDDQGVLENAYGICPFIYFPQNANDKKRGYYWVVAETGTHCSWSDLTEILYCWTFWVILKELLDSVCTDFIYEISEDGEDHHYTLGHAFSLIKKANPEFAAMFPHGRLPDAVRKSKDNE